MKVDLIKNIEEINANFDQQFLSIKSLNELVKTNEEYLGKKGLLTQVSSEFRNLDNEDKKEVGQHFQQCRKNIESKLLSLKDQLEEAEKLKQLDLEYIDLTAFEGINEIGSWHLISQVQKELEDIFVGMGYSIERSREVELDWYNFEALNFPPKHPARSMQDTFYVNEDKTVMRTHTSNFQIRTMLENKPPIYSICSGRVYRNEADDARHSSVFHQIELLAVDDNLTFGDLAGTIETFMSALFQKEVKSRLISSYFPFTEPSAEAAISCVFCDGAGCKICSNSGWIEIGGCGMVHPNVLENVNYDSSKLSGFAFGFGIERMAMIRHGIDSVGLFYESDLRFLKQFKRFV